MHRSQTLPFLKEIFDSWASHWNLGFLFKKANKNLFFNQSCLFYYTEVQYLNVEFTQKDGCILEVKDMEIHEWINESADVYQGPAVSQTWSCCPQWILLSRWSWLAIITQHGKPLVQTRPWRNPMRAHGKHHSDGQGCDIKPRLCHLLPYDSGQVT